MDKSELLLGYGQLIIVLEQIIKTQKYIVLRQKYVLHCEIFAVETTRSHF